jgi:hypothetical protein
VWDWWQGLSLLTRIVGVLVIVWILVFSVWLFQRESTWLPNIVTELGSMIVTLILINVLLEGAQSRRAREAAGWAIRSPLIRMGDLIIRTSDAVKNNKWQEQRTMIEGGWQHVAQRYADLLPYALADAGTEGRDRLRRIEELLREINRHILFGPGMTLTSRMTRLLLLIREVDRMLLGYSRGVFMESADKCLIDIGAETGPDGKLHPLPLQQ